MNSRHDSIPDNAILLLIAFTSMSLSRAEQCYSNIECEALGITEWTREVLSLLFHKGSMHNHRP